MSLTSQDIIDRIIEGTDIVLLISGYIPLKRAGRNFKALCPFHHEKTSSFIVSPEKQIYHCFGCAAGGNAINFLMRYEHLEFREALEILAKGAGISLPRYSDGESKEGSSLKFKLYKVIEMAANFYHQFLLNSASAKPARDYLAKRSVKNETIKKFKLGFAVDSKTAVMQYLRSQNISLDLIEKAGLAISGQAGLYDRFRSRLTFPIFDIKERPIAFGGRLLSQDKTSDSELAKYINCPETPIYSKGRNLYGLNFAKDSIKEADCAIIVEGYFDFILPFQEGQNNIVASSGTALTEEQIRLIKRFTENVIMVFDADKAGESATLRSLDMFIEEGINLKVASLAEGFDPDSFVRKFGIEGFRTKCLNCAQNIFDYKLCLMQRRHNARDIEAKAAIVREMINTINKFNNEVLRSNYLKKLAQILEISEESVVIEAKRAKSSEGKYNRLTQKPSFLKDPSSARPVEKLLLQLMLEDAAFISRTRQHLEVSDFQSEHIKKIVGILFDCDSKGIQTSTHKLMSLFSDERINSMLAELSTHVFGEPLSSDKERIVDDCILRITKEKSKLNKSRLHQEIKRAQDSGDSQRLDELVIEYNRIIKEG
ncbi:MAG: DNA primase [Candidatus Omnitrophota bacterium]